MRSYLTVRGFILGLVVTLISASHSGSVFAHTMLVSASPAMGTEVDEWPEQIVLEFDENLITLDGEKTNFVIVNNAIGDQVSDSDEVINGNSLSVTLLPNAIKGQVLVYYRVVSTDGHPVEGEYSFSYGVAGVSEQTVGPESEKNTVPVGIYLTSAIFIISGLFFSIYSYRRRSR